MTCRITELKSLILSGGPSFQEMPSFAMRDFGYEATVRQAQSMEDAIAKGDFPAQVGPFRIIGIDKKKENDAHPAP